LPSLLGCLTTSFHHLSRIASEWLPPLSGEVQYSRRTRMGCSFKSTGEISIPASGRSDGDSCVRNPSSAGQCFSGEIKP
jgi:hypothetical protein